MNRNLLAFLATLLLLSFTISSSAQSFTESPGGVSSVASVPRISLPQTQPQIPAQPDPSVITVRPELTDEQVADLHMVRKEYREASLIFRRLSDADPRNAVYLNKLGISLHQQAALTLAFKCYERAIKADPTYADAENNIGTVWYQRKRYGKAIRAYQ